MCLGVIYIISVSDFIGSILCFKCDGLGENDITKIRRICLENQIKVDLPKSIVDVYIELYDPNRYFEFDYSNMRIVYSRRFMGNSRLKDCYFNKLSIGDKNQIYYLVNRL